MELWNIWYGLVNQLSTAFSRKRTFFWMVTILIGFSIQSDYFGVTSLARGVDLLPGYYTSMLHFFSSNAIDLDRLLQLWIELVLKNFDALVTLNGRQLLVVDGIKIGKEGKKMPGVKWLHQDSDSNSKAEYIMGHSIQAIAILVQGLKGFFALPLTARIHEGIRFDCNDRRTLMDKLIELLCEMNLPGQYYLLADKYYCSGGLIKQLVAKGIHIITMMKKNAVAYYPVADATSKGRGRPKKYGEKIKLFSLFNSNLEFVSAAIPGYTKVVVEYCAIELLWRPLGETVKFVLVKHPERGNGIVMSTDLTIDPIDMIFGYSLRFKIEVLFKQAVHQIGTFMYRFWLKAMKPRGRGNSSGDHLIHFAPSDFKEKVASKIESYHLFIQLGLIAQGLMQYLSLHHHQQVWKSFGSWLRTIRDETLPSEKVVSMALRNTYYQFLRGDQCSSIFKKFLRKRTGNDRHGSKDSQKKLAA